MTQVSDNLPSDEQMVRAIKHKKDLFTSRFVKHNKPTEWSSTDNWYFDHVCTVLNHASKMFQVDVDDLINTKPKLDV